LVLYLDYLKDNQITYVEPEKDNKEDEFWDKENIEKINNEEIPF
jgi:hypothetical protein